VFTLKQQFEFPTDRLVAHLANQRSNRLDVQTHIDVHDLIVQLARNCRRRHILRNLEMLIQLADHRLNGTHEMRNELSSRRVWREAKIAGQG
jgi:hypothetical protein